MTIQFVFPPEIQGKIASGVYEIVKNKSGELLSIARDKTTGHIVSHAIAVSSKSFIGLSQALTGGLSVIGDGILSFQMHKGFQHIYKMLGEIQSSLVTLQATTSLIGVASIAGVALSGANLYQTLKLRKEVQELKYQVKDGFIKVLEEVRGIPDEIIFKHHRTILIMAYGEFLQAIKLMKLALSIEDNQARYNTLSNAQLHLSNAVNAYSKPELFEETTAVAQLRRFECLWMIEQTQAINFQLMNAPEAACHCLSDLQLDIQSNSLKIIDHCGSEDELKFIYPEIVRLNDGDLSILNTWQNKVEWMRQLTPSERQEVVNLEVLSEDISYNNFDENEENLDIIEYDNLESQCHYESMRNQLKYLVKSDIRQHHINYIKERAMNHNLQGIIPTNFEDVSNLSVANLYEYLKVRENN